MKNILSFEKELETSSIKNLSFNYTPTFDIYSTLYDLYFNIMQEPVPIKSLHYSPIKTTDKVVSLYHKDTTLLESSSLLSQKEEDSDFITTFKIKNPTTALIKKDLIRSEEDISELFNMGFDSYYLYASLLDTARLQYFIEIAREFKTEAIVLIQNQKDTQKVLLTDSKIVGVTDRNHLNQKLSNLPSKRSLFEFLIDNKPELVLVHDSDF